MKLDGYGGNFVLQNAQTYAPLTFIFDIGRPVAILISLDYNV